MDNAHGVSNETDNVDDERAVFFDYLTWFMVFHLTFLFVYRKHLLNGFWIFKKVLVHYSLELNLQIQFWDLI